jgi:hypothetical protein
MLLKYIQSHLNLLKELKARIYDRDCNLYFSTFLNLVPKHVVW